MSNDKTLTIAKNNPLNKGAPSRNFLTDPQECCEWANARLHPDAVAANLHWVVTGDPARPIALVDRG